VDGHRPLSRPRTLSKIGTIALAAIPAMFLGYFFAYPLLAIVWRGIAPDGVPGLDPFLEVLGSSSLRGVAWFTLWQAALSTLLTLAVGLPTAYVFARFRFPGKGLLRAAATVPFVLPTLVVGTAFIALIGPGGALGVDLKGTVAAILIAHVFYNYAIVVRGVGSFWEQIDPGIEDAARTLGASRWRVFREITLPLLSPAIVSAASLVFLFTFTSFGVVLVLGDLQHATLEVEIWRQTANLLRLDIAAALAIMQLIGVGTLLIFYGRYQQRRSREIALRPASGGARPIRTSGERLLVTATISFMVLFLGGPIAVLIVRSFRTGDGFGVENYAGLADRGGPGLFIPATEAIGNTVRFAVVATLIAITIGAMAAATVAYSRGRLAWVFDAALMVPLGTSAVTIGFGFLIALDRPVDLRTSLLLVPIAHALVAIPFVVRTSLPVMRSVQHRLREAAAVLGAGPGRVWREVDLPIISRALLVGAAFAFAISAGEFGATAFIARPGAATVPIAIFRLLSQPGTATFGRAMALSVVLMAVTGAAVFAIERLRPGAGGDL
jgi:thiamine transport system permease protein